MGSIHSEVKLKIKCPECNENLYGLSCFDDYNQEDHTTYCKKCGFTESLDETFTRIVNETPGIEIIKMK